ncbi:hypothetical protein [Streptomyces sp. 6N106]|uniref:hypothetical protein n=1 Tax=Streptomyces sp. 6N106 TaxID=3457418 RepID=UPI003FD2810D
MAPDSELRDDLGGEGWLITGIKREFLNPTPVKQTAETVQQAFGRERVLGYLLAVKLHVSAHKVPVEAGLGRAAHVSLSEFAAQGDARIHLSMTLAETPGLDDSPRSSGTLPHCPGPSGGRARRRR